MNITTSSRAVIAYSAAPLAPPLSLARQELPPARTASDAHYVSAGSGSSDNSDMPDINRSIHLIQQNIRPDDFAFGAGKVLHSLVANSSVLNFLSDQVVSIAHNLGDAIDSLRQKPGKASRAVDPACDPDLDPQWLKKRNAELGARLQEVDIEVRSEGGEFRPEHDKAIRQVQKNIGAAFYAAAAEGPLTARHMIRCLDLIRGFEINLPELAPEFVQGLYALKEGASYHPDSKLIRMGHLFYGKDSLEYLIHECWHAREFSKPSLAKSVSYAEQNIAACQERLSAVHNDSLACLTLKKPELCAPLVDLAGHFQKRAVVGSCKPPARVANDSIRALPLASQHALLVSEERGGGQICRTLVEGVQHEQGEPVLSKKQEKAVAHMLLATEPAIFSREDVIRRYQGRGSLITEFDVVDVEYHANFVARIPEGALAQICPDYSFEPECAPEFHEEL